jgi:DNA mismatch endonuclease (patch repair protein)|tara:strand:+ start:3273 stop:3692 length:420 start_codon:yes stop_codon:yes gene_type:complete
MMSGIRGKDTKPEITVRKGLHARGFRYRLHDKTVAGKPDLILPRYRAAIFVHGCFWHQHGCHLFKMPSTRREFWMEKLAANRKRDAKVRTALLNSGWRILTIWECALKGRTRLEFSDVIDVASAWITGQEIEGEVAGGQ